jgi:hypothetical protein
LFPERKGFTVLLIFGKSELDKIKKAPISPAMVGFIDGTKQFHDGKWLWIRWSHTPQLNDIKALMRIKREPDR